MIGRRKRRNSGFYRIQAGQETKLCQRLIMAHTVSLDSVTCSPTQLVMTGYGSLSSLDANEFMNCTVLK